MKEILNGRIKSTFLGREDHGILTAYLQIEGESWGCGFGGLSTSCLLPFIKTMGFKSPNAVVRHINELVKKGYAKRSPGIILVTREPKRAMTPCRRKCWECGNVADHEDNITPWVNCKKCGSQDTRLVKEKKPLHSPVEAIQKLREDYAEWLELNNYTIGLIPR